MKAHPDALEPLSFEMGAYPRRRDGLAIARERAPQDEGRDWRMLENASAGTHRNKKKKDQLALAQCGISALGPAPTIPGGWGLRNPKPKEPDQRSIFFSQVREAGGWPKWGGIVILANDPVTNLIPARVLIEHNFLRETGRQSCLATLLCAGNLRRYFANVHEPDHVPRLFRFDS